MAESVCCRDGCSSDGSILVEMHQLVARDGRLDAVLQVMQVICWTLVRRPAEARANRSRDSI